MSRTIYEDVARASPQAAILPHMAMRHWLMKSEPQTYSIDDLARDTRTSWEGVRNYQARNFMREMKVGNLILFHHSNALPPGVVGIARVCREAYPDRTALDPRSAYHDPKATKEKPIWEMVDIEFVERFERVLPLENLRERPELKGMAVLKRGQRLSVQPVEPEHFRLVRELGRVGGSRSRSLRT